MDERFDTSPLIPLGKRMIFPTTLNRPAATFSRSRERRTVFEAERKIAFGAEPRNQNGAADYGERWSARRPA